MSFAACNVHECQYKDHSIRIDASTKDIHELVCKGMVKAIGIFAEDFSYDQITYSFNVTIADEMYHLKDGDPHFRVFGIFNSRNGETRTSSPLTEYARTRTIFLSDKEDRSSGLRMTDEFWVAMQFNTTATPRNLG